MGDCVNVDVSRYEVLISRESKFDLMERAYHSMKSWEFDEFCKLIFGKKTENEQEG